MIYTVLCIYGTVDGTVYGTVDATVDGTIASKCNNTVEGTVQWLPNMNSILNIR